MYSETLIDTVNLLQKIEDVSLVTQLNSRKKTNFHATIDIEKLYPRLNSNPIKVAFIDLSTNNSYLQQHQPPFKRKYRFIDDIYLLIQGSKSRCNLFPDKIIQELTNFSGLTLTTDGLQTFEANVNFLDINLKFLNGKWVT